MLESTDFACTLKETKTTIPISRTPKPISEFGLKPGKYRPSAVKVAGFDPLDANHAASTGGVASRPRQDVQTRKGKHWNERQPNDTAHANDRDGNGLRDREHAGRPGAGPIRAVRPSPDRRRSDGVSRELSCKPYLGPIPHTLLEQPYSFTAHPRKEPKDDETRSEKGHRAHTRVRDAVRLRRVGRVRRVCGRYDHRHVHANPSRTRREDDHRRRRGRDETRHRFRRRGRNRRGQTIRHRCARAIRSAGGCGSGRAGRDRPRHARHGQRHREQAQAHRPHHRHRAVRRGQRARRRQGREQRHRPLVRHRDLRLRVHAHPRLDHGLLSAHARRLPVRTALPEGQGHVRRGEDGLGGPYARLRAETHHGNHRRDRHAGVHLLPSVGADQPVADREPRHRFHRPVGRRQGRGPHGTPRTRRTRARTNGPRTRRRM